MDRILTDSFGRKIENVRISVTDRCNFRCRYCMPSSGMVWMDQAEILSYEEIAKITGILVSLGVSKVRLTGGEPLMRKDLDVLVGSLRKLQGLDDIALTTNGYFLAEQVEGLAAAGLDRMNVSLDSLDPATFELMARRDYLSRVMQALPLAKKAGLSPIKLNVVLIRGVNEGEIADFTGLARTGGYVVRFIEFMPIGKDDDWSNDKVMTSAEVLTEIAGLGFPLHPISRNGIHAAERYRFADGAGEIGFISPVSEPFCHRCNRIRLTSDGKLRTCLFSVSETDLKAPLRGGASDEELGAMITSAVMNKEEGHIINREGFVRPERTMSSIGG